MSDGFTAHKSFRDGCVTVKAKLKCVGSWGGDSISVEGSADLSTDEARALAAALIAHADAAEAKFAKKAAADARRKVWRDREVAAGRMKVFTMGEFLGKEKP